MSIQQSYAVFGLGRYGRAVAEELVHHGVEVIAVDINQSAVNAAANSIPICKCADVTDPEVIQNLGISHVDVVVISMANNLEASVLATMLCKEAGVPKVIVKCSSEMHRRILKLVGADQALIPETESGVRMAKNLLSAGFMDIMELSRNVSMVEMDVLREWVGKSLKELNLRKKYAMNIVALRKDGNVTTSIDPDMPLEEASSMIVIVDTDKLDKLRKKEK